MSDLQQISPEQAVKLIAMYLPQYHPIPENDRWWGDGFTEWTNVRKAEPRFPGHYQPQVPGQLGYYDLRDPHTRRMQAELAASYGIHGFCYYHYWFNGRRLLEAPFNEVLSSGEPAFPFCLCWANENWTRTWDGLDREVLIAQEYSDEDCVAFIRDLFPAFRDERYIRVNGKPLLLVYRTSLLPDPKRAAEIWREEMHRAGMGELYLVRVENFVGGAEPKQYPDEIGFDAAMEFAPYWGAIGSKISDLAEIGLAACKLPDDISVYDYEQCMHTMMARPVPSYKLFRGIFPAWDNSPRRKSGATLFVNNSPSKYAYWLYSMLRQTIDTHKGDERLMFVNAWNEWGEGCHLEPDNLFGTAYLNATRLAVFQANEYECNLRGDTAFPESDRYFNIWYNVWQKLADHECLLSGKELVRCVDAVISIERSCAVKKLAYPVQEKEKDELEHLTRELSRIVAELEAIRTSVSWKLTAPVRHFLDKLTGRGH